MSISFKSLVIIILINFTFGCAGIDPSRLKKAANESSITLEEAFVYDTEKHEKYGYLQLTIAKGVYNSLYQNSSGVFYEGKGYCCSGQVKPDTFL